MAKTSLLSLNEESELCGTRRLKSACHVAPCLRYIGSDKHRLSEPIAALSNMKLTEPIQMPSSLPLVLAELAGNNRAAAEASSPPASQPIPCTAIRAP